MYLMYQCFISQKDERFIHFWINNVTYILKNPYFSDGLQPMKL